MMAKSETENEINNQQKIITEMQQLAIWPVSWSSVLKTPHIGQFRPRFDACYESLKGSNNFWGMLVTMVEELYTIVSITVPRPKPDFQKNENCKADEQCHGPPGTNISKNICRWGKTPVMICRWCWVVPPFIQWSIQWSIQWLIQRNGWYNGRYDDWYNGW